MKISLSVLFVFYALFLKAQQTVPLACDKVYPDNILTTKATFPDGEEEMYHFIYKSLRWQCGDKGYAGTSLVDFMVDREGNISDVKIQNPIAPCFDDDIIRAIKLMPRWIPATINGVPVCSEATVTIRIHLGMQ